MSVLGRREFQSSGYPSFFFFGARRPEAHTDSQIKRQLTRSKFFFETLVLLTDAESQVSGGETPPDQHVFRFRPRAEKF